VHKFPSHQLLQSATSIIGNTNHIKFESTGSLVEHTFHITMRLFRRSKKERRCQSGDARPFIEGAGICLNPDDRLFFDDADSKVLLSAPDSFFRRLSKKSRKKPAPPAALKYPQTHLFRHVKPEDKLTNWGADPITGVRYENPHRYLDPPTESMRFVSSSSPAPQVEKLLGGKWPVKSHSHYPAKPPGQVSVELPHSRIEAPAPARPAQSTTKISYLETLSAKKSSLNSSFRLQPKRKEENPPPPLRPPPPPTPLPIGPSIPEWLTVVEKSRSTTLDQLSTESPQRQRSRRKSQRSRALSNDTKLPNVQEPKEDPRHTPVDPAKVATESPRNPPRQMVEKKSPVRLIPRVFMSIVRHILLTVDPFLPAWRISRNSEVAQDELMNAWWSVWLAMVYCMALWGLLITIGSCFSFLAKGFNWVLGIVSVVMVLSLSSSCCLANG